MLLEEDFCYDQCILLAELYYMRPGAAAGRSYPMPKVRGGGHKEQPHVQGAVAAQVQEG